MKDGQHDTLPDECPYYNAVQLAVKDRPDGGTHCYTIKYTCGLGMVGAYCSEEVIEYEECKKGNK